MKKSFSKMVIALVMVLPFTAVHAQLKNAETVTVKIYGNCGMCETNIEKAGNLKKTAAVDWNKDTKMATITFDAKKTNQDEILKRIALAGYDSDSFLAPDEVYEGLHGCCQYEREAKVAVATDHSTMHHNTTESTTTAVAEKRSALQTVFEAYFAVKDALVATDAMKASTEAEALLSATNAVDMNQLEMDVHTVWIKVVADLKKDAQTIGAAKDIAQQRSVFTNLSATIYALLPLSASETPTYYQFCPMANEGKGAHWLSKNAAIQNPYYGAAMMGCGKTVQTIE